MNGANRVASACCWKRHLVTSPLYMARSSPDSSQIETGSSRKTTRGGVAASQMCQMKLNAMKQASPGQTSRNRHLKSVPTYAEPVIEYFITPAARFCSF